MSKTVLAVVAHPDDESFWMGGTLARYAAEGDRVVVIIATDGRHGRSLDRAVQFKAACQALGVEGQHGVWFLDQLADTIPQALLNQWVETQVRTWQPTIVLTHYHSDLNLDHRRVAEAVLVATRDRCGVWMATPEFPERCIGPAFTPTIGIALDTAAVAAKWAACSCYYEELTARPVTRSADRLCRPMEMFVEVR